MKLLVFLARIFFTLKWVYLLLRSGWTTPNTAGAGTPVASSDYNTYVRDNLTYLFSQRPINNTSYIGSAITSTSTSWVAVSTTNARMTKTINSGRVRGAFTFSAHVTFSVAGSAYIYFTVYRDGATNLGDATYGLAVHASGAQQAQITVPFMDESLSVGSHDYDLYWKLVTVSGTVSAIRIECANANGGTPILKHLIEV